MKQTINRNTEPLGDAKLDRLASLLGEFLARAWMKRTMSEEVHLKAYSGTLPNQSNRHRDARMTQPK